jgi:hypothetical protein
MIDTLTYAKKLEMVGFTKEQSEALIMMGSELSFHHLATKEDVRDLRSELQNVEHRILLKVGVMMGTMFMVFFAALSFMIQVKG